MNEAYMVLIKNTPVYSGERVYKGRTRMIFRRIVFDPVEGDFAEIVDASGKIHKCSPAELKL